MKTTIELAREAGIRTAKLLHFYGNNKKALCHSELEELQQIERFAALVRADERNSWPAEMEAMERQVNILTDALAAEREACAQVVVDYPHWLGMNAKGEIANAIRNRGNT
jgi:hypothetical protein